MHYFFSNPALSRLNTECLVGALHPGSADQRLLHKVHRQSEKTLAHDDLRDVVRESFELARDLVSELQIENWRLEGEGVEIHERTAACASLLLDHLNKTASDPAGPMVLVDPDLLELATFTPPTSQRASNHCPRAEPSYAGTSGWL